VRRGTPEERTVELFWLIVSIIAGAALFALSAHPYFYEDDED
jgi:hypothetical protein